MKHRVRFNRTLLQQGVVNSASCGGILKFENEYNINWQLVVGARVGARVN